MGRKIKLTVSNFVWSHKDLDTYIFAFFDVVPGEIHTQAFCSLESKRVRIPVYMPLAKFEIFERVFVIHQLYNKYTVSSASIGAGIGRTFDSFEDCCMESVKKFRLEGKDKTKKALAECPKYPTVKGVGAIEQIILSLGVDKVEVGCTFDRDGKSEYGVHFRGKDGKDYTRYFASREMVINYFHEQYNIINGSSYESKS